ncbi:MAG: hypothetical protein M0Z60_05060 [Nitrospiraceae bacterium]|nr:hypothetical protein [Nitrospiraceae bacterium]
MKGGSAGAIRIIAKYYEPGSLAYDILLEHSKAVAGKALEIAGRQAHMNPDLVFVEEAAMLHYIGIFGTNAPSIGCYGDKPYVCHGYLGREVLEGEGLPIHALVCERHVGVGISIADIDGHGLPIPRREMLPVSIEEKIICFADKFFTKKKGSLGREKPLDEVRAGIAKYGADKLERFEEMVREFG